MHSFIAWWGFIAIVLLVLEWFFRITIQVRSLIAALTNRTPSVEADVRVLMVDAETLRSTPPNPYERYAAVHEVIQHRKGW